MTRPNINYTLRHDLCTGCGVCTGACPSGAISTIIKKGRFLPFVDKARCLNDKGCHRCTDVCPGLGVDLAGTAAKQFSDQGIQEDRLVGKFLKCYSGHCNEYDIRYHCASGGMVSGFLIFLLEHGYIDGAVVTAFDPDNELLVRTYIARNREEVLKAKGSKYAPVSLHRAAADIKAAEGNRFIIVGLPCHIAGFRKLETIDRKFREKVAGYFGIYCSSGRTFYMTEHVFKERNIRKEYLTYFAYRDEGCLGSMVVRQHDPKGIRTINGNSSETFLCNNNYKERYQSYYHPLRSFFIPRRCLLCIDHYAELADISFGDIHVAPYRDDKIGVNSLIVRKQLWIDLLEEAKRDGWITLDEINVAIVNSSQAMAYKKKGRNARFIALNKRLGRVVPEYGGLEPPRFGIHDALNYAQTRFQQFLGRHKSLWWAVTLLKKDTSQLI